MDIHSVRLAFTPHAGVSVIAFDQLGTVIGELLPAMLGSLRTQLDHPGAA